MNNIPLSTLTDEDRRVINLMLGERSDWTSQCFTAALTHLVCAHRISEVDPAMAMFRAITAEEEAATGLLRALKIRRYKDSERVQVRNHVHKAAVFPFLLAIAKHTSYLKIGGVDSIRLAIAEVDGISRLVLGLILNGELQGQVARPNPPLNIRYREGENQAPVDYRRYFLQVISPTGYQDVLKYLEAKANERNVLLYASPQGLRRFDAVPDEFLLGQKVRVLTILKATLLFWPYDEIQPFVEEAIQAFLSITDKLQREQPTQ